MKGEQLESHLDQRELAVLHSRPAHGYAIADTLRARCDGASDRPEGRLYPVLRRLQAAGMVADLKDQVEISQTAKELVIHDTSSFQGRDNTRELRYDLSGKTIPNDGPMGDHNETVATWVAGKIVTTWTRDGAVAGTKSVMTETRSLSADGKTMTLASVRGESPAVVMVFEKQ